MFSLEAKSIEVTDDSDIADEDVSILVQNLGSFSATLQDAAALRKNIFGRKLESKKPIIAKKPTKKKATGTIDSNEDDDFDLLGVDIEPVKASPTEKTTEDMLWGGNNTNSGNLNDMDLLNVNIDPLPVAGNRSASKQIQMKVSSGNDVGLLDLMTGIQPLAQANTHASPDLMAIDITPTPPQPRKKSENTAPNYDDLLDIDNFQSSITKPIAKPKAPENPLQPNPADNTQHNLNQNKIEPNSDSKHLDLLAGMGNTPANANLVDAGNLDLLGVGIGEGNQAGNGKPESNDLLGFSPGKPADQTNPNDKYDFGLLDDSPQISAPVPSKTEPEDSPVQIEKENDDPIWLSENDIDTAGNSGMKVRGKFFESHSGLLKMKMSIYNRTGESFRSPRVDLRANFYGMFFVGEGPSFTLDSVPKDGCVTVEKGRFLHDLKQSSIYIR